MINVSVVPATPAHVPLIMANCREPERKAYRQLGENYVRQLIENSAEAWCGFINEQLACMWTVSRGSIMTGSASVWITTAKGLDEHPFVFARHSRIRLTELCKRYGYINGIVLADNEISIKWLRWLGFTIGPPEQVGDYIIRPFGMRS